MSRDGIVTVPGAVSLPRAAEAVSSLSKHGKTFHFASRLLDRETALKSARLYRFCRYIDDIADDSVNPVESRQQLDAIDAMLACGYASDPVVADLLALARECSIEIEAARELVRGVRSDLERVRFIDESELLRYCYRVA